MIYENILRMLTMQLVDVPVQPATHSTLQQTLGSSSKQPVWHSDLHDFNLTELKILLSFRVDCL